MDSNLYFMYDGVIRYTRPITILLHQISKGENGETFIQISYRFFIGVKIVERDEIQVFKRRADLIKSYEND